MRSDPRYAGLAPDVGPGHRVPGRRGGPHAPLLVRPIAPDLLAGRTVLVAAHGNSLRALIKHLEGISDADITELEIPTGVPIVYALDGISAPGRQTELGDQAAIAAAAEAVRRQGERR